MATANVCNRFLVAKAICLVSLNDTSIEYYVHRKSKKYTTDFFVPDIDRFLLTHSL